MNYTVIAQVGYDCKVEYVRAKTPQKAVSEVYRKWEIDNPEDFQVIAVFLGYQREEDISGWTPPSN